MSLRIDGNRRKLVAVVGAVAAVIVIGVLVARSSTSGDSGKTGAGPVSSNLVHAGELGNVADVQGLKAKIEPGLPGRAPGVTRASSSDAAKCETAARALQPQATTLVYVATARWQGTDAEVFGFSPPGAPATTAPGRPSPTRVYVLARSDCHLLVFQSFAP
jgi:hypothetical protein